jgi:hypothetical protein
MLTQHGKVMSITITARLAQAAEPAQTKRAGRGASEARLRTDLELAKQDNRRLRVELDRLKNALRDRLGINVELHPLSLSGAESMNSWRLMIATAAKTLDLQRNSMMLASSFVPLKMTSLPHGRVSVA